jgi:YQGE family putative transporter
LGVGASFFYPFYAAPLIASVFDVIGATERAAKRRVECVVSRELALNLGRIVGILFFIWWMSTFPNLPQIRWFVLIIGFTQLLTWLAIRHVPVGKGDLGKEVC